MRFIWCIVNDLKNFWDLVRYIVNNLQEMRDLIRYNGQIINDISHQRQIATIVNDSLSLWIYVDFNPCYTASVKLGTGMYVQFECWSLS